MATDKRTEAATAPGSYPAGSLLALAGAALLLASLVEMLVTSGMPGSGPPAWLALAAPALIGLWMLRVGGVLARRGLDIALLVAFAALALALAFWPAAVLAQNPAPMLAAASASLALGLRRWPGHPGAVAAMGALTTMQLLLAVLALAARFDSDNGQALALGWSAIAAHLALGLWLLLAGLRSGEQRMLRLCAAVLAGIGLLVMAGWALDSRVIVQGGTLYVPMQFNTALCSVLAALALNLLAAGRRNHAFLALVPVVVVAVVSLLEEYAGLGLGAGEWLLRHDIVAEGVAPGRMAPNTATAFLLGALGIALAPSGQDRGLARWSATWACGFMVAVIGVIVLSGYLLDIPVVRAWGSHTPMALLTGLGIVTLGLGLCFAGADRRRDLGHRGVWIPVVVAMSAVVGSVLVWYAIDRDQALRERMLLERQVQVVEQILVEGTRSHKEAIERLAERLDRAADEAERERVFDLDARAYLRDFPSMVAIVWADQEAVARRILSRDPNPPDLIGKHLDYDETRAELFRRAERSAEGQVSPSLRLINGEPGELVVVRSVREGRSLGFVVAAVEYSSLFPTLLEAAAHDNPLRLLRGESLYYSRGEMTGAPARVRELQVMDQPLRLELWPEPGAPGSVRLANLLLFTGLATGGLLALALRLAALARHRAEQAERMGRELRAEVAQSERTRVALGEAERELGGIFESISDAFYTLDHDWRFVLVNPRAEQLMQRSRAELVGKSVWEAFPEAVGSEIERQFRKAATQRCTIEFEVYFPPLASWFAVRVFPHPSGIAVYFQDISERKHAETGLLKAQASSERAQRLAQLGGWEYDLASGELDWSEEALRIFGLSRQRLGRGLPALLERVHFDDRTLVQEAQRRLHAGEGDIDIEYRVLRPDGETCIVREMGTLVRDEHGQPLFAAGAIQDISERRRTEDALRELTRRLEQSLVMNRLVMDNSLDVICAIDANGRFSQVSAASLQLWGYSANELVGRAHIDLVHPDDRGITHRASADILAGRPTLDFRNRYIAKDGRVVTMQWSAVWSQRDRLMFAVARDVTETERQSRALAEANESLERSEALLRIAGRAARLGGWAVSLEEGRLFWSDEVCAIHERPAGYSPTLAEALEYCAPPWQARIRTVFEACASEGTPYDEQLQIITATGRLVWVRSLGQAVRDPQGRIIRVQGAFQDITERKQAEAVLEGEREFLTAMLESLSEGIVACDAGGRLTLFNRATRELHGLPEQPLPAGQWAGHYNLYQPDGHTPMLLEQVPLLRVLRGEVIRDVEMVIAPHALARRTVRCSGQQIRTASGELLGAVVAMHDITEAKRAQRLESGQRAILAGIAARQPLRDSLVAITRLYEEQYPGALCSVLLLDEAGERVLTGAAPSLPEAFSLAVHGQPIGPRAGSCGTAAWRGERVVVADIHTDPLWVDYLPLAREHGLRACWSTPVKSAQGKVLATFATYYREPREPIQAELAMIDGMAAVVAMAIEQEAAYRELQLSEQRFRSLFDEHPDAVFAIDREGRYTAYNGRLQGVAGASAGQVLGRMFDENVAPEQRDTVRAHFNAAVRGEARTYEATAVALDGQRIEMRVTNLPIVVDGRVTGVFGIAQDISLLRKHQRELAAALDIAEKNSHQLRRLSESAIAINRSLGEKDMYQQLVDQLRDTLGAHQALVGLSILPGHAQEIHAVSLSDKYAKWRTYDTPSDGSGIYALVCETNRPLRLTQAELEAHPRWRGFGAHAAGHPPLRGWLAVPLIASDGSNLGVLQLSDKVSGEFSEDDELVAMQFAQMASIAIERARLIERLSVRDRFFDMSLEIFVIFNPASQRFMQVNPMLAQITGYSQEELCGRVFLEFLHPDDHAAAAERADRLLAMQEVGISFVNRYVCRDGSLRWLEWVSVPAPDGLVYAVGRDITERHKAEAALRQTLIDLNNRNRELQDFAFIASHDLQEPLRKIRAFSDRLQQRHAAGLAPEARDYLDRTGQAAARMQVLIDDLLAYSRVDARGKPFVQADLNALLANVLEDLEVRLESSGGRVEAGPLPTLEGDVIQLRQVFQNLLANALKFRSPERLPVVRVSAEPTQLEAAPAWILRFEDNGIGFEPKYGEKIFGPFQRLHGRQEFEGTGIGLAIVRRIVERHRGTVTAQGRPGVGASFVLTLPAQQPASPEFARRPGPFDEVTTGKA